MTLTGTPVPAGKWRPRTSCPATESTSVVNCSAVVRPSASSWVVNSAAKVSASAVVTQTARGRRPTRAATFPQMPFSYDTTSSWRGTNGKNQ